MKAGVSWGIALAFVAAAAMAADKRPTGGRVLKVGGQSTLDRGGQVTKLEKGTQILQGDTVRTGGDGKIEWWMQDDSLFVLPSNSALHVDEFSVEKKKGAVSGTSFMSLLKGGLRSITGLIAKNNYNNYKIASPVATMGVRGTDFSLILCQDDCQKLQGSGLKGKPGGGKPVANGLYLKLIKGGGNLCNRAGCVEVSADGSQGGACAVARAADIKPEALSDCPDIFIFFEDEFEFDFDAEDIDLFRDLDRILQEPGASTS